MSIIKGLFLGLRNQKVIPFNQMTPELHNQISSSLAKLMMVAKMTKAKLTKAQRDYITNQAKQVQEFEDRYITKIKDSAGNLIKKDEKVADVFDLKGRTLDPNEVIMGGTQEGAELQSGIMKATGAKPTKVKETEAEIAARMRRENKEAAERIRRKQKETMDDMKDIEDPEDMATGGRAGFIAGGITNLAQRLIRGFMTVTGRKPNAEELQKIMLEAAEKDMADILSKVQTPGLQSSDEFAMNVGGGIRALGRKMKEIDEKKLKETIDNFSIVERDPIPKKPIQQEFNFAEGGRIGLKDGPDMPGRRKFMKIMGGIASLPFIGKYLKPAVPLIQKGAEISGPALDKIIQTVMSAGKLISQSGRRVKEMVTKKKLKDVEVEEDIMDGPSYTIKTRDKTIYYKPGRQDEMGIEDDIIEVIEDTVTKKAGGGIARMLGE